MSMTLTDAVTRLAEIRTGDDDTQAAIVAALTAAPPEQIGRAVLLVARDLVTQRMAILAAEREAASATIAAQASSRGPGETLQ